MLIKKATFVGSFPSVAHCPKTGLKEFAFIGRSNVGKSSIINMLTNNNHLAKTSNTPGKTQQLNFFHVNETFYFVDLPGYGYAKVARGQRMQFQEMISVYLRNRPELVCLFQLIDSCLKPQPIDIEFTNQLAKWQVPFTLVFTKSDKAGNYESKKNSNLYIEELKKTLFSIPQYFITSSKNKDGKEEILNYIGTLV